VPPRPDEFGEPNGVSRRLAKMCKAARRRDRFRKYAAAATAHGSELRSVTTPPRRKSCAKLSWSPALPKNWCRCLMYQTQGA
jgi:hypothetical protein